MPLGAATKRLQVVTKHFIIQENSHLRNGRYVADNRDWFLFGRSTLASSEEALADLREALQDARALMGHDLRHERQQLAALGIQVSRDVEFVDSMQLFRRAFPGQKCSLLAVLNYYNIPHHNRLHNAGNDAHLCGLVALYLRYNVPLPDLLPFASNLSL